MNPEAIENIVFMFFACIAVGVAVWLWIDNKAKQKHFDNLTKETERVIKKVETMNHKHA